MVPSWAKVGAKVVCIQAAPSPDSIFPGERDVVVRQVYTIRKIDTFDIYDTPTVYLVEIINPPVETVFGLIERGFDIRQFRPLVSLESDMEAHFYRLLEAPFTSELAIERELLKQGVYPL